MVVVAIVIVVVVVVVVVVAVIVVVVVVILKILTPRIILIIYTSKLRAGSGAPLRCGEARESLDSLSATSYSVLCTPTDRNRNSLHMKIFRGGVKIITIHIWW